MRNELSGGPAGYTSSPLVARRCQSVLPSLNSNISSEENGRSSSATSPILNPFHDSFEAAHEESKQPLPHDHLRLGLNEDFFKPDQVKREALFTYLNIKLLWTLVFIILITWICRMRLWARLV